VVGHAFALQQQRTQRLRALGHRPLPGRFQRHAIGPGIGHRRVARDAPGQAMALQRRQFGEAAFDALVHIAQVRLQAQHLFANDRETEVARFDDAGVHRANCDLVHTVAFNAHEPVVGGQGAGGRRSGRGAGPQRRRSAGPHAVVEPGPCVFAVLGVQARQVGHGALHAAGAAEQARQVGVAGGGLVERKLQPDQALGGGIGGAGGLAPGHMRHAPHRDQARAFLRQFARGAGPLPAVDPRVPDRQRRRQPAQVEGQVRQCHGVSSPAWPPPGGTTRRGRAGCTDRA